MSSVIKLSALNKAPQDHVVYVIEPAAPLETEYSPYGTELVEQVDMEYPEVIAEEEAPEIDPLEMARIQAEAVLEAAGSEAESIRSQAYEEGLQEGRAAGETEWLAGMQQIAKLAEQVNADKDRLFADIEPQVVKLSVEIAEKIIRHEVSANPDMVLDLVKAGLRQLRDKDTVKVRVNPGDVERVKQKRPDLIDAFDGIHNMEVAEDRRVEKGSCIIDAPGGVLDARVSTQLKEIERVVMEAANEHAGHGNTGAE